MQKYLIVIVGPTAVGKTDLSIKLANRLNTVILSADSRQFYKEMSIGTAKPTEEELRQAPHYFINTKSINEFYSAGEFEKDAIETLNKVFDKNDTAIMVGGSGLYINAVCDGLDNFPDIDDSTREKVNQLYDENGLEFIQQELKKLDEITYIEIELSNPRRVIRALEVCYQSGKPYSSFKTDSKAKRNFTTIKVGLTMDRALLYERINKRVDLMMEAGLLDEVKSLEKQLPCVALETVGYAELFSYLKEDISLETATELIKRNSRRYAKRQLTWFKRDMHTKWFEPSEFAAIEKYILQQTNG